MLNTIECNLVTHLSNAGKGLIQITEIIAKRRIEECDYDLLTEVTAEVHRQLYEGGE